MGRNRKPIDRRYLLPEETRHFEDRALHVWCKGIDDMHVFPEDRDKEKFLEILARHLSPREIKDENYRPYRKLYTEVDLFAVNVLDNHYHLILFQMQQSGLVRLMTSVLTGYGHYFNKTHGRQAQIFESPYTSRPADDDEDVRSLIAYVHGNHETLGLGYDYSSHRDYLAPSPRDFINVQRGLSFFDSAAAYESRMRADFEIRREAKALRRAQAPRRDTRRIKRGRASHIPGNKY